MYAVSLQLDEDRRIEVNRGGTRPSLRRFVALSLRRYYLNFSFRAATMHIRSSIQPWRKREMLVSP